MTDADLREKIEVMHEPEVLSVKDVLKMPLDIPDYQRPYKWSVKNVSELFEDISTAFKEREEYGDDYFYRVGTIIIHNDTESGQYHIVDGQQRVTTLLLIEYYLCTALGLPVNNLLLKKEYRDPEAKSHLYLNYDFICKWFAIKKSQADDEKKYLEDFYTDFCSVLQVVVLYVDEISEAFQLFDSQNARGKELDPHDLLKAYHLRAMKDNNGEMEKAVNTWEAREMKDIKDLFTYLFNIWNWSRKRKCGDFTTDDIDIYKGVSSGSPYTYAIRIKNGMPEYQISEPFVTGEDFFKMVEHYLDLHADVINKLKSEFKDIYAVIENDKYNEFKTFKHAKNLFLCVIMCYYDRFNTLSSLAVTKLFAWSFMICIDVPKFDEKTIQKYAIGEQTLGNKYSNTIPMFSEICESRRHTDIEAIYIYIDKKPAERWEALYKDIESILGVASHE